MTFTRTFVLAATAALLGWGAPVGSEPFQGRWDLTMRQGPVEFPSWLEAADEAGHLELRMVGRGGSVHPVQFVSLDGGNLKFADSDHTYDCAIKNSGLSGVVRNKANETVMTFTGERAPKLRHPAISSWSKPIALFDGKDLAGWTFDHPQRNNWTVVDREMVNTKSGSNIITTRKFNNFKLHIEFNCPAASNSGVYLRGRYETQIEYEPQPEDALHRMGSIYGFLAPTVEMPRKPGSWQSFDITLIGRRVTVVQDGTTIIKNKDIPGPTGGALDSHEAQPGPIYLQGDHGSLKFRNIRIQEAIGG